MRDSTKRRLEKLETQRHPWELPRFQIVYAECRYDPDGTFWRRNSSTYDPSTGVREELDEPWELVRHGSP